VLCFGSADSEGVTGQFFGSVDSKGVSGGTLDRVSGDLSAWGYTPGDLQRARKSLIVEELAKHSFLKSAQEYESTGFIFWLFLQKTERVKQEGELTEQAVSTRKE